MLKYKELPRGTLDLSMKAQSLSKASLMVPTRSLKIAEKQR